MGSAGLPEALWAPLDSALSPCPHPTLVYLGGWLHLLLSGWGPGRRGREARLLSALSAAVAAGPHAQVLYSPRVLPPSRLTGMSLPFSSHIWVLGTGAPSPGGLAAWAPARVPCADQRRSGLAGAQVKRAWPYMECLPGWWAPPDPAQLPPGGAGVGRGSPPAPGGASAPAPGAAPVRGPPRPGLPCARGLWKVPPHCIPTSGSLLRPPNPRERLQGGGRRVQVVEWWWAGEIEERSHPESWVGQEGDPSPSSPAITSPRYPERPGSGGLTLSVPTPTGEGHRQREGAQLSRGRQLAAGRESGAVGGGAGLPGTGSGRWL